MIGFHSVAMRTEIWQTYDFVAPGVFLLRADMYPLGTAVPVPGARAVGVSSRFIDSLLARRLLH